MSKERITVTIEEELVQDLDRAAQPLKQSRSNLIEMAVRMWKKVRLEQDLIKGYRAMAEEDLKIAEKNLSAGYKVLK